jgi:hypothetical protein
MNKKPKKNPSRKDVAKAYIRGEIDKQIRSGKTKLKSKAISSLRKYAKEQYESI